MIALTACLPYPAPVMAVHRLLLRTALCACALLPALSAPADGTLQGHARYHKVTGRDYGWNELYEYYINVCPDGSGTGQRYRAGSPPGQMPIGDGSYAFTLPAGRYALLSSQPKFAWRGRVVSDVQIANGQLTYQDAITPQDYSVAFGGNSSEWGSNPWTSWTSTFAQTFVATGTSITRASYKLAGKDGGDFDILVSIHAGGPTGPQVGPSRRRSAGAGGDSPVAWRSGEVPTVPGQTYAIKFTSSGGQNFAFYRRLDSGDGYSQGAAYVGGSPIAADLYACIGSDNDGTVIPYCKITGLDNLPMKPDGWWSGDFGQTFRATGSSLAAVEGYAATVNTYPNVAWEIRQGGPGGAAIGPVKTVQAQFQGGGVDHFGVAYNPGEVPLVAGQTYYVRCTSPGMHFLVFEAGDAYPDGQAYESGNARSDTDLYMTIYEYAAAPQPGRMQGLVEDPGGNAVEGAVVTLDPDGLSDASNRFGYYEILDIPAGTYDASAAKAGYITHAETGIVIEPGGTRWKHFVLAPIAPPGPVTVVNPGFETGDLTGWTQFGVTDGVQGPGEWFGGIAAREGSYFLGAAAHGGTKSGGVRQAVPVVPGNQYTLSAWYHLQWDHKPAGNLKPDVRLAVDPTGGTDINGAGAIYSPWGTTGYTWTRISLDFEATTGSATIFLQMRQRDSVEWNITCFDAVAVELPDSDGDGIPDFYELARPSILDPHDPHDAGEDPDGDGFSNLEEYLAGTDPEDSSSYFRVTVCRPTPTTVSLEWNGNPPFNVWRRAGPDGTWTPVLSGHAGNSCTATLTSANDWFRVEIDRD